MFLSKFNDTPISCHEILASRLPTQIRLVLIVSFRQKSTNTDRRFGFPSTNHTKHVDFDRMPVSSYICMLYGVDSSRPCNLYKDFCEGQHLEQTRKRRQHSTSCNALEDIAKGKVTCQPWRSGEAHFDIYIYIYIYIYTR